MSSSQDAATRAPWRTSLVVHGAAASLLVFILMLSITLPRTALDVQVGDGADFAAAALSGGLAHPPGFPVFTQLMAGQTYAGIATANAWLQSAAAALLCGVATLLGTDALVGAGMAVTWGLYPATLQGATDAEVFALHHFLALVIIIASIIAVRRSSFVATLGLGVTCGLGGATHPIAVFWAPWVLWALWRTRRVSAFGAALVLGLTPYLLLWGRYKAAPTLAFADITTWTEWAHYVLRRGYGTFQFSAHQGRWQSALLPLLHDAAAFAPGLLVGGLLCGVRSVSALRRAEKRADGRADEPADGRAEKRADGRAKERVEGRDEERGDGQAEGCTEGWADGRIVAAALTIVTHIVLLALVQAPAEGNHDVAARFMPSFLLAAACGAALAVRTWPRRARWLCTGAFVLAPAALAAPAAIDSADARHDLRAAFVVDEALREAPARAVYFAATDTSIFGATLRHAQGVRPDVDLLAVPRLAGGTYRTHLAERIPELAAVALDERRDLGKLALTLQKAGRPIIADPIAAPPPLVRSPLGVVFAWGTEPVPPVERERLHEDLCARLPPALATMPAARRETQWMWNLSFERAVQAPCKR